MKHRLTSLTLLGIPIARATSAEALAEIERLAETQAPAMLAYVNAHSLELSTRDAEFRRILQDCAMVLNDGVGVSLAARLCRHGSFPENLNGTDFSPKILKLAGEKGWRIFLLGAAPGVAEKAAAKFLDAYPGIQVAGTRCGYFSEDEAAGVANQIREARTDLLFVGMGNPAQEKWLARYLMQTNVKIAAGVGAFLDFSAGVFPRAPLWMRNLRVEWIFRMSLEPGRLWKRYVLGGPVFLARVVLHLLFKR